MSIRNHNIAIFALQILKICIAFSISAISVIVFLILRIQIRYSSFSNWNTNLFYINFISLLFKKYFKIFAFRNFLAIFQLSFITNIHPNIIFSPVFFICITFYLCYFYSSLFQPISLDTIINFFSIFLINIWFFNISNNTTFNYIFNLRCSSFSRIISFYV